MQNIILFDQPEIHQSLLPLTFTRPIADLRIGILTIRGEMGSSVYREVILT